MAAISANTLFHFTKKRTLADIFKTKGFFVKCSLEHFDKIRGKNSEFYTSFIPMVSFCDLTIMQLARDSDHTKKYGGYGIGLKKDWGISNCVTPVTYVHKKSLPSNQIDKLIPLVKGNRKLTEEIIQLMKFLKPYKGKWDKKGKRKKDIEYYNEREWRYSPEELEVLPGKAIINKRKRINKVRAENLNKYLKGYPLYFKPDDIKHIIINNKSDIPFFVKAIRKFTKNKIQRQELTSKIKTFQEIAEDY